MPGISAVVTAAGESSRMGRPKPLLLWHGVTLVEYQVHCLHDAGASEIIVVLGHEAGSVLPHIGDHARHVLNPRYRQGKTTSIVAGISAVDPGSEGILLLAVDQPRTAAIISRVMEVHTRSKAVITSPRYQGHGGHPLVFSTSLRGELEAISEEREGIREVFAAHRHEVTELAMDDPMIRLDLNTLEAYEEAKARYGA